MLLCEFTLTLDSGLYLGLSPYFTLLGTLDVYLLEYILVFLRAGATLYSLWNAAMLFSLRNAAQCLVLDWCPVNSWNGACRGFTMSLPCSISGVLRRQHMDVKGSW